MLLLAGLLSVSFFYLLLVGLHGLSSQRLYLLLPEDVCSIHPSKAFWLLELSLDVCTGLSHSGSVNYSLILRSLRVERGVCPECLTRSFIEIGGSLIYFLYYCCNFGHIGGLFDSHSKSMQKGITVAIQGFWPSLILKSRLGLVSGIASHAHPSTSKTSAGACPPSHFWASVEIHCLSSVVKEDIWNG